MDGGILICGHMQTEQQTLKDSLNLLHVIAQVEREFITTRQYRQEHEKLENIMRSIILQPKNHFK
jgi:hypothetical protein